MLPALREVTLPALRRIGRIARCTKSPCARRTSTVSYPMLRISCVMWSKAASVGGLVVGALSDSVVFLANRPNR